MLQRHGRGGVAPVTHSQSCPGAGGTVLRSRADRAIPSAQYAVGRQTWRTVWLLRPCHLAVAPRKAPLSSQKVAAARRAEWCQAWKGHCSHRTLQAGVRGDPGPPRPACPRGRQPAPAQSSLWLFRWLSKLGLWRPCPPQEHVFTDADSHMTRTVVLGRRGHILVWFPGILSPEEKEAVHSRLPCIHPAAPQSSAPANRRC